MPLRDREDRTPRPPVIGHIRLGTTQTKGGKTYPVPSETFVFTSAEERFLLPLAAQYGGEVKPYEPQGSSEDRFRLISASDAVVVLLPFPTWDANLVQFYELWARSGIQRRCDGLDAQAFEVDEQTGVVERSTVPCLCDGLAKRECSTRSTLRVWMPQTGLGIWELSTTSTTASFSLADEMVLLEETFGEHQNRVPVTLSLREKEIAYVEGGRRKTTRKRIVHASLATDLARVLAVVDSAKPLVGAVEAVMESGRPALAAGSDAPVGAGGSPPTDETPPSPPAPSGRASRSTSAPAEEEDAEQLDPWNDWQAAFAELKGSHGDRDARKVAMAYCQSHKLGWPVKEDWPAETLRALASHTRTAARAARQEALT